MNVTHYHPGWDHHGLGREQYKTILENLAGIGKNQGFVVSDEAIKVASWPRLFFEKVRGFFGFENRSNIVKVNYEMLKLLRYGAYQKFLEEPDVKTILKRLRSTLDSLPQRRELDEVIQALSKPLLRRTLRRTIKKYYEEHRNDLQPCWWTKIRQRFFGERVRLPEATSKLNQARVAFYDEKWEKVNELSKEALRVNPNLWHAKELQLRARIRQAKKAGSDEALRLMMDCSELLTTGVGDSKFQEDFNALATKIKRYKAKILIDKSQRETDLELVNQAIELLQDIPQAKDDLVFCYRTRANILFQQERYEEGLQTLELTANVYPEKTKEEIASLCYKTGFQLLEAKKFAFAIEAFKKATQICPDNETYWEALGNVELHENQWEQAAVSYAEAIRCASKPVARYHFHHARALQHIGNLAEAIEEARKICSLEPNVPQGHHQLLGLLIEYAESLGISEESVITYHNALEELGILRSLGQEKIPLQIQEASIHRALASYYQQDDELDTSLDFTNEAVAILETVFTEDPQRSTEDLVTSYLLRAEILSKEENYEDALEDLEKALALNPNDPLVQERTALGRLEELRIALKSDDWEIVSRLLPLLPKSQSAEALGIEEGLINLVTEGRREELAYLVKNHEAAPTLDRKISEAISQSLEEGPYTSDEYKELIGYLDTTLTVTDQKAPQCHGLLKKVYITAIKEAFNAEDFMSAMHFVEEASQREISPSVLEFAEILETAIALEELEPAYGLCKLFHQDDAKSDIIYLWAERARNAKEYDLACIAYEKAQIRGHIKVPDDTWRLSLWKEWAEYLASPDLLEIKDLDAAIQKHEQLLELLGPEGEQSEYSKKLDGLLAKKGLLLKEKGDIVGAIDYFERTKAPEPLFMVNLYLTLIDCQEDPSEKIITLEKAVSLLKNLTKQHPYDEQLFTLVQQSSRLGKLYEDHNREKDAKVCYETVIDIYNKIAKERLTEDKQGILQVDAATAYAALAKMTSDASQALDYSQKAHELLPSNKYRIELAERLFKIRPTTTENLKKAVELQPDNPIYLEALARNLVTREIYHDAKIYYEKLLTLGHDTWSIRVALSHVFLKLEDPLQAVTHAREATKLAKNRSESYQQLAESLFALGRIVPTVQDSREKYQEAALEYQKAAKFTEKPKEKASIYTKNAEIFRTIFELEMNRQFYQEAFTAIHRSIEYYKAVEDLQPDSCRHQLSTALIAKGSLLLSSHPAQALIELQAAEALGPMNFEGLLLLARAYRYNHQETKALEKYNQALIEKPHDATLLGELHEYMKDKPHLQGTFQLIREEESLSERFWAAIPWPRGRDAHLEKLLKAIKSNPANLQYIEETFNYCVNQGHQFYSYSRWLVDKTADYQQAIKFFEIAYHLHPKRYDEYLNEYIDALTHVGRNEEAIKLHNQLQKDFPHIAIPPLTFKTYEAIGDQTRDLSSRCQYLKDAFDRSPHTDRNLLIKLSKAYRTYGEELSKYGHEQEARQCFEEANQYLSCTYKNMSKGTADYYYEHALILKHLGYNPLKQLQNAYRLDKTREAIGQNLTQALVTASEKDTREHQYSKAIEKLIEAREVAQQFDLNELKTAIEHSLAEKFVEIKDFEKAVVEYQKILELDPTKDHIKEKLFEAHILAGNILYATGQGMIMGRHNYVKARDHYAAARKTLPHRWHEFYKNYVDVLVKNGQVQESYELAKELERTFPDVFPVVENRPKDFAPLISNTSIAYQLALQAQKANDGQHVNAYLRTGLSLDPTHQPTQKRLSEHLHAVAKKFEEKGHVEYALTALEKACDKSLLPSTDTLLHLACLRYRQLDTERKTAKSEIEWVQNTERTVKFRQLHDFVEQSLSSDPILVGYKEIFYKDLLEDRSKDLAAARLKVQQQFKEKPEMCEYLEELAQHLHQRSRELWHVECKTLKEEFPIPAHEVELATFCYLIAENHHSDVHNKNNYHSSVYASLNRRIRLSPNDKQTLAYQMHFKRLPGALESYYEQHWNEKEFYWHDQSW